LCNSESYKYKEKAERTEKHVITEEVIPLSNCSGHEHLHFRARSSRKDPRACIMGCMSDGIPIHYVEEARKFINEMNENVLRFHELVGQWMFSIINLPDG
tara:strand:- start:222 stop:521 length:300 start_codon:yes stop_codon:yes gene_type:complete